MDTKEETTENQCAQCKSVCAAKYLKKHKMCSKCKKSHNTSNIVTRSQTLNELRDTVSIIEEINKIMFIELNCKEKTHIEKMFAINLAIDELLIKRINAVIDKNDSINKK